MSGFVCPHCSAVLNIFGEGGGKKLADDYGIPFLGSIPIDIDARILGDKGKPIILEKPDCEVTNAFKSIINLIEKNYQDELQAREIKES
jgi:ATP-binding protein involved in chromosome partitioning